MNRPVDRKRNIALIGHNGSGKTVLLSAMLFNAGLVDRITSKFIDTDPIEESKGSSISSHVFSFDWKDYRMTVIDTPGFGDFIADVSNSVFVTENVVTVINAVAGVEIQTERTWQIAEGMNKPIMVFINQMDKERASFENALNSLETSFGKKMVVLTLPMGSESEFRGLVDLIAEKAYVYENGRSTESTIPSPLLEKVKEMKLKAIEDIVESDDSLMEKYLEGQQIQPQELANALLKAYRSGLVVPVLCGSAEKNMGVDLLMNYLAELGASPLDGIGYESKFESGEKVMVKISESEPFCAYNFKTIVDPFVGRVSYIKIIAGIIKPGDSYFNVNRGTSDKFGRLYLARGKEQVEVDQAVGGDIVVLPKLKEGSVTETLTHKDRKLIIIPPSFPEPMFSRSVNPKSKADIDKISNGLSRLAETDP
ncbi:MAG: GTP-binding protein, partial [Pseudothermotoga sp.]